MFWRIPNFSASSPVESILDKEDFTLEELLDEEDTIQECKALNTRLINFLRDRAQVEKLLRYIVEDVPTDAENRPAYKFPFIACEIFTCEVDVILKTLVDDDELMDILFSFLNPNHTHNTLLAGYFSKVVLCLMLRKTTSLVKYVQTHGSIFHQLIDLIHITSIMEILVRLVAADDHMYPNFLDVMQWLADSNLLEMIVDKLSPSNSPEVHANAAEVLWAITRSAPSALASKLSSPSFVSRILNHALEDSLSKSSLVYSLSVCISLLDPKRPASTALIHSMRSQQLYELCIPVDPETVSAILPKLGDLLQFLSTSSEVNVLPTTFGELRPPLGKHRLKIVEFIAVLLGTGSEAAEKELSSSGAIRRILDLFFEYPFNNFLHHHVESIINSCLESKSTVLVDHLFFECDLITKLVNADRKPFLSADSAPPTLAAVGRQPPRVGYIGHITRMANKLVQVGSCNERIRTYLQENVEWIDWQMNVINERNAVENVNRWSCGRPNSLQDVTRDSDEDEHHDRDYDVAKLSNNLSQAFRYNVYENDDADEDVYFQDESTEVVISSLRLGDDLDDERDSSPFTNSNWFAFQEDRISGETLSTSAIDRMEDVSLSGMAAAGDESDQVLVGEDEEFSVTSRENGFVNHQLLEKPSAVDDTSPFQFETSGNDDLFNDQQLPDWVGWREPSDIHIASSINDHSTAVDDPIDIHVDSSDDLSTPPDIDPGVAPYSDHVTSDLADASKSEPGSKPICGGPFPSVFEEEAEFVGADSELMERPVMRDRVREGVNGVVGVMPRVQEIHKSGGDGPGMREFCDKGHWRVEPEVGIVQE